MAVGASTLEVSDKHASVNGDTLRLRDRQVYLDIGSRRGQLFRGGGIVKYEYVRQEDNPPVIGQTFETAWLTPYIELDSRDLEWYPSKGVFARVLVDGVTGTKDFMRSSADLRSYFKILNTQVPSVLALRILGATTTSSTPDWAHFYYGFRTWLRGYSAAKSESSTLLLGDAEVRLPLTRETTYDVPLLGRYGKDFPFWLGIIFFGQRSQLQLGDSRDDVWALGTGIQIRLPYVNILELSYAQNRDGVADIVINGGINF
jgi:outer membrane protein assembly factor BamA